MTTPEQIAEWERLAAEATAGPWVCGTDGAIYSAEHKLITETDDHGDGWMFPPDATFISAARTAVPALVAEVRRLREALEQIERYPTIAPLWRDIARAALEGSSK